MERLCANEYSWKSSQSLIDWQLFVRWKVTLKIIMHTSLFYLTQPNIHQKLWLICFGHLFHANRLKWISAQSNYDDKLLVIQHWSELNESLEQISMLWTFFLSEFRQSEILTWISEAYIRPNNHCFVIFTAFIAYSIGLHFQYRLPFAAN